MKGSISDEKILEGIKRARKNVIYEEAMRLGEIKVSEWLVMVNKDMSYKEYQATLAILQSIIERLPKINKVN
jgi:hypothetical protein